MNASRVNVLRQTIHEYNDNLSKILLGSKESIDRRVQIEYAFRACKEAFLELLAAYLMLLDGKETVTSLSEDLKNHVKNIISETLDSLLARNSNCNSDTVSRGSSSKGSQMP